jgi:hypothetical protein
MLLWAKSVAGLSCCKQQLQTVLTLYLRKIKNTSATQMRGFKDWDFKDGLLRFARNDEIDGFPFSRE